MKKSETKWPTLEGRLKNPIETVKEALVQLQKNVELTEYAKKRLLKKNK